MPINLRSSARTRKSEKRLRGMCPKFENLEARLLLYSPLGDQWTYSNRITYSLMPDGTNVGGVPSTLYQMLGAKFSTTTWMQQIETAASLWENVTNVNLAQVPDGGEPVGTSGNQQDDPRFGDIRIGAIPLSSSVLAITFVPPAANGGTDAGDVLLNSNVNWQIGSNYDLMTVVAHELGHALGLGESSVSTSVMYGTYDGIKQQLASDDISGIQSIYGTRQFDRFNNGSQRDNSYGTATNINSFLSKNQIAIPGLDITTVGDSEWFYVTVPANSTGTMSVSVQSSNLSLLSPRIQVYNSSLNLVSQSGAVGSLGATVNASASVQPGQGYYLKVLAAGGPGPIGGYGLIVSFSSQSQSAIMPPNTAVAAQPDKGQGSDTSNDNAPNPPLAGLQLDLGLVSVSASLSGWAEVLSTVPELGGIANVSVSVQPSDLTTALQDVAVSIAGLPASTPASSDAQPGTGNTSVTTNLSAAGSPSGFLQAIDQAIDEGNLVGCLLSI